LEALRELLLLLLLSRAALGVLPAALPLLGGLGGELVDLRLHLVALGQLDHLRLALAARSPALPHLDDLVLLERSVGQRRLVALLLQRALALEALLVEVLLALALPQLHRLLEVVVRVGDLRALGP